MTNPRLKLLLVEDHQDTGAIFTRLLLEHGYDVVLARSVAEAIALFEEGHFDGMISDMGLPDGSGLDVMRHISARRSVPAIAVSALSSDDDVARSLAAGFRAHLAKPIDVASLMRLIADFTGVVGD